jgi:hypothetical protein
LSFDTQHTPRFILSTTVSLLQLLSFIFREHTRNIISLRTKTVCKLSEIHIILYSRIMRFYNVQVLCILRFILNIITVVTVVCLSSVR